MSISQATCEPRNAFVDQVRGFALLGMVVVNAPFLAMSYGGSPGSWELEGLDRAIRFVLDALVQGKFYLLFSFLFGYSVSRFIDPDSPRGHHRYVRRLVALAVLGVAHIAFFSDGDILHTYALLGCILLLVLRRSDDAVVVLSFIAAKFALIMLALNVVRPPELIEVYYSAIPAHDAVMREGSFLDAAWTRVTNWLRFLFVAPFFYGLVLAAMGLGTIAGRWRFLDDPAQHGATWRVLRRVGLMAGLPLALWSALYADHWWAYSLCFASAPLLSAGYLGGLAWLYGHAPRLLVIFQSAGRMSLTCYILQSVVLSTIYCGYGLGYFGTHSLSLVILVALSSAVGIGVFSRVWLSRFTVGPLEQLVAWWCREK
jgi:uncharacterized protein